MRKRIDIKGQVFGRWTALRCIGADDSGFAMWECVCECGNKSNVRANNLRYGLSKSCGCLNREINSKRSVKNLVGCTFGRLHVVAYVGSDKHQHSLWKCICDCGETRVLSSLCLSSGNTKSCGCLKIDELHGRVGENHPLWIDGRSYEPYCEKWNENLRERVREFFGRTCVICDRNEAEEGRKIAVHHVTYDKGTCCNDTRPEFIILCMKHNAVVNKDRENWKYMFRYIIEEIYNGKCYYTIEEYNNLVR